ncbi:MAG TPA: antibiotic biosynthesis monooxygenase [Burkholderiales bacterium]|nr:antibiotic biosynthesis monooxygenase [Burkholderiales bacterium]
MIAVIFEFTAAARRRQEYLQLAAILNEEVKGFDGFLGIERFQSLRASDRYESLSFWRDEEAVRKWRNVRKHREAQAKGRGGIFSSYRLRVCSVIRDYGMKERGEAPKDSIAAHG